MSKTIEEKRWKSLRKIKEEIARGEYKISPKLIAYKMLLINKEKVLQ